MEEKIRDYRDLRIWQEARRIVLDIYQLTATFPPEEKYGLVTQLRRSAISIVSNIAEGFARQHNKEYRQFLFVSIGSCAELDTQLTLATDLCLCEAVRGNGIQDRVLAIARMIRSLIKKL